MSASDRARQTARHDANGTRSAWRLIPPHFPSASAADYETLYTSLSGTGGAVGVYTAWADAGKDGAAPAVVAASAAAAAKYRFGPVVVALGVAKDAPGGVSSTVDWSGQQRDRFISAVTTVAREQKPEFLALGVESDRLWMSDPAAFDGFVKGYADAYDSIKKVSPSTKVFTIFQLELMPATRLDDGKQSTAPQGTCSRSSRGGRSGRVHDVPVPRVCESGGILTTTTPTRRALTGARRGSHEIGWPYADWVARRRAPVWRNPAEQYDFVTRSSRHRRVRPALALWSFPNDVGAAAPPTFSSIGLRQTTDREGRVGPVAKGAGEVIFARATTTDLGARIRDRPRLSEARSSSRTSRPF